MNQPDQTFSFNTASQAESPEMMRTAAVILGIPVDALSMEATLNRLDMFIKKGRKTGQVHQVATVNVDFVVNALNDPELRYLLQQADLTTADGMPLVWASRLLGTPNPERVAGADLVPLLAEHAARCGYSMYFLGAAPGIASRAAEILKDRYPRLKVVGVHSPPFRQVLEMDRDIIAEIRAARPDILMVAFGNPKQEKWIELSRVELPVPVMIGVGGSLDFLTGTTRRAPGWMQQAGLEWLHRLLQEPRRLLRRYIVDLFTFTWRFLVQWWRMHPSRARGLSPGSWELRNDINGRVVCLKGVWTYRQRIELWQIANELLLDFQNTVLDLAAVEFMDSAVISQLVDLGKRIRAAGGELILVSSPGWLTANLSFLQLDDLFQIYADQDSFAEKFSVDLHTADRNHVSLKSDFPLESDQVWMILAGPRHLDARAVEEFERICRASLHQNPYLMIDLSGTLFLTSAGLAMLASLQRLADSRDGALCIRGCSQDVFTVVQLARFDLVLDISTKPVGASLPAAVQLG